MSGILYARVPGFYAEVERSRDAGLRGRPVLVGGDPRKRGRVQAATEEAVRAGVRPGMAMLDALELCPGAAIRRTDLRTYREVARRLRVRFSEEFARVEPEGLDAAYLDRPRDARPREEVARRLRDAVRGDFGLPLRVGIAGVRFVARLASEEAGPEAILRVPVGGERRFLAPLAVTRLPGVGPQTAERLAALGARTVGQLAELDPAVVEELLGNHGLGLQQMARGEGDAQVRDTFRPRSLSQETTLPEPVADLPVLDAVLARLAAGIEEVLRLQGHGARRVTLKVRYADGETATRTLTRDRPVTTAPELHQVARALLARTQAGVRPVRLLGLSVSRLAGREPAGGEQLDLFCL